MQKKEEKKTIEKEKNAEKGGSLPFLPSSSEAKEKRKKHTKKKKTIYKKKM